MSRLQLLFTKHGLPYHVPHATLAVAPYVVNAKMDGPYPRIEYPSSRFVWSGSNGWPAIERDEGRTEHDNNEKDPGVASC